MCSIIWTRLHNHTTRCAWTSFVQLQPSSQTLEICSKLSEPSNNLALVESMLSFMSKIILWLCFCKLLPYMISKPLVLDTIFKMLSLKTNWKSRRKFKAIVETYYFQNVKTVSLNLVKGPYYYEKVIVFEETYYFYDIIQFFLTSKLLIVTNVE